MRKVLLAAVAMVGLWAAAAHNASAAPSGALAGVHARPAHGMPTNVEYYWRHHHYHHRHWSHGHWHYWN